MSCSIRTRSGDIIEAANRVELRKKLNQLVNLKLTDKAKLTPHQIHQMKMTLVQFSTQLFEDEVRRQGITSDNKRKQLFAKMFFSKNLETNVLTAVPSAENPNTVIGMLGTELTKISETTNQAALVEIIKILRYTENLEESSPFNNVLVRDLLKDFKQRGYFITIDPNIDQDLETNLESWQVEVNTISQYDSLSEELKFKLNNIRRKKFDSKGNLVDAKGFLGLPSTHSFAYAYKRLIHLLGNSGTSNNMMRKVNELKTVEPLIAELFPDDMSSNEAQKIQTLIWAKIASNYKYDYFDTVVTKENGTIVRKMEPSNYNNNNKSVYSDILRSARESKLVANGKQDGVQKNSLISKLDKAFDKKDGQALADALVEFGLFSYELGVDPTTEEFSERVLGLYNTLKAKDGDLLGLNKEMTASSFQLYTDMIAENSLSIMNNNHLNSKGQMVYQFNNSNFTSRQISRLQNGENIYENDSLYDENITIQALQNNDAGYLVINGIKLPGKNKLIAYSDMNKQQLATNQLIMLNERNAIELPIHSDSGSMTALRYKKKLVKKGKTERLQDGSLLYTPDEELITNLVKLARNEIDVIKSGKLGANLQIFPELQFYLNENLSDDNLRVLVENLMLDRAKNYEKYLIKEGVFKIVEYTRKNGIVKRTVVPTNEAEALKGYGRQEIRDFVYNYALLYPSAAIVFNGHPNFYNKTFKGDTSNLSDQEIQAKNVLATLANYDKRTKQIWSPTTPLFVGAFYTSPYSKEVATVSENYVVQGFRDIEGTTDTFQKIIKDLEEKYSTIDGRFDGITEIFKSSSLSDGQSFIDPFRYKQILIGLGEWNDTKEYVYQQLIKGEFNFQNLTPNQKESFFNPLKGFHFSMMEGKQVKPFQKKDSELVMHPMHGLRFLKNGEPNTFYNPLYRFFLERMGYEFTDNSVKTIPNFEQERSFNHDQKYVDVFSSNEALKAEQGDILDLDQTIITNNIEFTNSKFDYELDNKLRAKLKELYPDINLEYVDEILASNSKSVFNQTKAELLNKINNNDLNKSVASLGSNKKVIAIFKSKLDLTTQEAKDLLEIITREGLKTTPLNNIVEALLEVNLKRIADYNLAGRRLEVNNRLKPILNKFFDKYNIKFDKGVELDETTIFDTINKLITIKNDNFSSEGNNQLSETIGEVALALLGGSTVNYSSPDIVKRLYSGVISTIEYKDQKKALEKNTKLTNDEKRELKRKTIAQIIGKELLNKTSEEKSNTFIEKVKEFIRELFEKLDNSFYKDVDNITESIIKGDYTPFRSIYPKGEDFQKIGLKETMDNQFNIDNGRALSFMQYFSKSGNIITGSIAYRNEIGLYREGIDALHDIDMVMPMSAENISQINSIEDYYKTEVINTFKNNNPDFELLSFFTANNKKILNGIIAPENIRKKFAQIPGSYNTRLDTFTEEERKQIYLFDFFLEDETTTDSIYNADYKINFSEWRTPIYEKLFNMGRPKDVFDYQKMDIQNQESGGRIIGQADVGKAKSILIDAVNQKQDTLPHEYAHHYIAMFRNTPIVQEGLKRWGSEEALVQAIGEQVVVQKGEALNWWNKFVKFIFELMSDKQVLQVLTDSFLEARDLNTIDRKYNSPVEIINQIQEVAKTTPDPGNDNFYDIKSKGKKYTRVTSSFQESPDMETIDERSKVNLEASSKLGTSLDNLVRDFFADELQDLDSYDLADRNMVTEFIVSLEELKDKLAANGETVVANGILLHNDKMGIAGTVDLLTYDKEGNFSIYDLKSMKVNSDKEIQDGKFVAVHSGTTKLKYDHGYKGGLSPRKKHENQLNLYSMLLFNQYGIKPTKLGVIPVGLSYDAKKVVNGQEKPLTRITMLDGIKVSMRESVKGLNEEFTYNENKKPTKFARYNPSSLVVKNEDYGKQNDVPSSFLDNKKALSKQAGKNMKANVDMQGVYTIAKYTSLDKNGNLNVQGTQPLTGQKLLEKINRLEIQEIVEAYEEVTGQMKDFKSIISTIKAEISKRGLSNNYLEALQIITDDNGDVRTLAPLDFPAYSHKIKQIINSIYSKKVSNPKKLQGVGLVNASSAGFTENTRPKIIFKEDGKGNVLENIDHIEALMPIHDSRLYKYVEKNVPLDRARIEALITEHKELEDVFKGIIWRTPNEGKYSTVPIKIIGFIPTSIGSAVYLPTEITDIAGLDFDIDKMYGFFYSFVSHGYNEPKILNKVLDLIQDNKDNKTALRNLEDVIKENPFYALQLDTTKAKNDPKRFHPLLTYIYELHTTVPEDDERDLINDEKDLTREIKKAFDQVLKDAPFHVPRDDSKAGRQNQLIDAYRAILSSSDATFETLSPASVFDQILTDFENDLGIEDNIGTMGEPSRSIDSRSNALDGKSLVGALANANSSISTFQQASKLSIPQTTETDKEGKVILKEDGTPKMKDMGFKFNKMSARNENSNSGVFNDFTQNNIVLDELKYRFRSQNISLWLAAIVDNTKNPHAGKLNLNFATINPLIAMLSAGVDFKTAMYFINHPAIRYYAKRYKFHGGNRMSESNASSDLLDLIITDSDGNPREWTQAEISQFQGSFSYNFEKDNLFESAKEGMNDSEEWISNNKEEAFRVLTSFNRYMGYGEYLRKLTVALKATEDGVGSSDGESISTILKIVDAINNDAAFDGAVDLLLDSTQPHYHLTKLLVDLEDNSKANTVRESIKDKLLSRSTKKVVNQAKNIIRDVMYVAMENLGIPAYNRGVYFNMIYSLSQSKAKITGNQLTGREIEIILHDFKTFIATANNPDPEFLRDFVEGKESIPGVLERFKEHPEFNMLLKDFVVQRDTKDDQDFLFYKSTNNEIAQEENMKEDMMNYLYLKDPQLVLDLAKYAVYLDGLGFSAFGYTKLIPQQAFEELNYYSDGSNELKLSLSEEHEDSSFDNRLLMRTFLFQHLQNNPYASYIAKFNSKEGFINDFDYYYDTNVTPARIIIKMKMKDGSVNYDNSVSEIAYRFKADDIGNIVEGKHFKIFHLNSGTITKKEEPMKKAKTTDVLPEEVNKENLESKTCKKVKS